MDPVTLVVAALTAGAIAGLQGTATEAVKDAYAGLRTLVRRRVSGRASGEMTLEKHESQPEEWRGALQAELAEVDAGDDTALIEAARRLMALLDPENPPSAKYSVDVRGAQGVFIGDHGTQNNMFPPSV